MKKCLLGLVLGIMGLVYAQDVCAESVTSVDGKVAYTFKSDAQGGVFTVSYVGTQVAEVRPGLELTSPFEGGWQLVEAKPANYRGKWKPVWGNSTEIDESWNGGVYTLREKGSQSRVLKFEARVYAEGFAVRTIMPATQWQLKRETTRINYPAETKFWPIYDCEGTYPENSLSLAQFERTARLPLTGERCDGICVSLLEAYARHYPRSLAKPLRDENAVEIQLMGRLPCSGTGDLVTPWRALQLGSNAAELVDNSSLVLNLNPPCALEDTSWIKPGLCISDHGNCSLTQDSLQGLIEKYASHNVKYLQIDWGWYGTEVPWNAGDFEVYKKTRPDMALRTDWQQNTKADLYHVVKGYVPYGPTYKWGTTVDFDPVKLVEFAKARGMGVCLYVRGSVLEKQDLDKLFATYRSWGIAGLKPGFVCNGDAYATEWNRKLIEAAARHNLWLDIHDEYLFDGIQRTYPHLMTVEGGGGEEGNHPVRQDVSLPFARCLSGPFDFTPYVFRRGVSHTHIVAFFLVYPGPTAIMRGGAHNLEVGKKNSWGPELSFFERLPMNYDESYTLDAKIGHHIVTARRKGKTWYCAGMTGTQAYTTKFKCDFLSEGNTYTLTLIRDADKNVSENPAAVREIRKIKRGDVVEIPMSAAGGFCAIVE